MVWSLKQTIKIKKSHNPINNLLISGGGLIGGIGGAGIIIIGGCGVSIDCCVATERARVGGPVATCCVGGFTGTGFGLACGFAEITAEEAIFLLALDAATFFGPIFSFSSSGSNPLT